MQDLNLRLNWTYPNQSFFDQNFLKVVGDAGFEPATPLDPNQVRYQTALIADTERKPNTLKWSAMQIN